MSDYRGIEIIINVITGENTMTDESAKMLCDRIEISVSEWVTTDEVMKEIKKRMLSIEDML